MKTRSFAVLIAAVSIHAHTPSISPTQFPSPIGPSRTKAHITVVHRDDNITCTSLYTTTSDNFNVATIVRGGLFPVTQGEFDVTAQGPGTAMIVVSWSGGTCTQFEFGVGSVTYKVTVTDPLLSGPNLPGAGSNSDPISTASGEFTRTPAADLSLGGPLAVSFVRYYASFLRDNGATSALGDNWMHNFDVRLAAAGGEATVTLFRGTSVGFVQSAGAWRLAGSEQFNYQLVSDSSGFRFLDPTNNRIYSFSNAGALTRIEDRRGNALTVTPATAAAGPDQVTDGLGRMLKFTYSGGKLTRVEDQTGRAVTFAHTGNDLASATDANGKTTTFSYTRSGPSTALMTIEQLPAGNKPYTQEYDTLARASKQTDSRGNATQIDYNRPSQGTTRVTDPLAGALDHVHQGIGNLTGFTDKAGQRASFTYDAASRLTGITDRRAGRTSIAYHAPSGYPASFTDPLGNSASAAYAAQTQASFTFHNLTRIDLPDRTSSSATYDATGNLTSLTDLAGKVWTHTYNSRGQVLTRRNPAGGVWTSTYSPDGTRASLTQPSGERTTYEYDAQKRLAKTNFPDNSSQQFSYNNRDQVTARTDERGKRTTIAYNDNNRPAAVTDPTSQTARIAYDTDERVSSITSRLGRVSRRTYDERGRLRTVVNPAGDTTTYGYDALSRPSTVSDSQGRRWSFAYDPENAITTVTNGLSNTWRFTPDARGRITRATNPLARSSDFAYDAMGRLTSQTNALSETTRFTYDARGLVAAVTLPEGIASAYTRNDLGQIATVRDPNRNEWARTHDNAGRPTSRTDPLGRTTTYSYDNRQRLRQINFAEGTAMFTYDPAGNLLRRLYSDNTDIRYSYDDNNRLVSANGVAIGYDADGRITESNGLRIGRDAAGRISSITYATGKTVNYVYNSQGLLVRVSDWTGGATELGYDAARNLTSIRRPNGVASQYTYATDGRLAGIRETGGRVTASIALRRDADGRVTSADRNLPLAPELPDETREFAYDAAHQARDFTYDRRGRLSSDSARSYSWDGASRLASFRDASGSTAFRYDAFGMLLTGRQDYVWNYALRLPSIAVARQAQADVRYYVHLPNGLLLYGIDAAENRRRFFHFDEMGSTTFLTNEAGEITDSYAITPYGELIRRSGDTENPFTFLGAWGVIQQAETGLYYMRARFYDSASARFLVPDPIRSLEPMAMNPYQYARANPLRFVDPTGLSDPVYFTTVVLFRTTDHRDGPPNGVDSDLANSSPIDPAVGNDIFISPFGSTGGDRCELPVDPEFGVGNGSCSGPSGDDLCVDLSGGSCTGGKDFDFTPRGPPDFEEDMPSPLKLDFSKPKIEVQRTCITLGTIFGGFERNCVPPEAFQGGGDITNPIPEIHRFPFRPSDDDDDDPWEGLCDKKDCKKEYLPSAPEA